MHAIKQTMLNIARQTIADWRKETCHPKSATAGGGHHDGMHFEKIVKHRESFFTICIATCFTICNCSRSASRNGANLFECWAAEECVA